MHEHEYTTSSQLTQQTPISPGSGSVRNTLVIDLQVVFIRFIDLALPDVVAYLAF